MNTIAFHSTRNHWGVAIEKTAKRNGEPMFVVHRVTPDNKCFAISRHVTESSAREAANKEWMWQQHRAA